MSASAILHRPAPEPLIRSAPTIIRMGVEDMPAFREHLFRLDAKSLLHRFGGVVQRGFLFDYVERALFLNTVSFCCIMDEAVRGVGELRRLGVGSDHRAEA